MGRRLFVVLVCVALGVMTGPASVQAVVPPKPVVTSITPTGGSTAGGTVVTVTGTNLTGATKATFGGTAGTALTAQSATQLTVTSPPRAAGTVDVQVTTPGGTTAAVTADKYTYTAPPKPVVTGITPTGGSTAGGTVVTVTGTNLTGATKATFGGTAGTALTAQSATQLTVTSPPRAAGTVDVQVTTPGGNSAVTAADKYTYTAPPKPVVTSILPTGGTTAGGTVVTVTGSNLTGATRATFGGTAGTALTAVSTTQLTVTSPARAAGVVDVQVTTPGGTTAAVTADKYTYAAPRPVTAAAVTAATTTSVSLSWTNPGDVDYTGVLIRRAPGATPPGSPTAGALVADIPAAQSTVTDTGLTPAATYSYALFAHDATGHYTAAAVVTGATNAPLTLTTTALAEATAGLRYTQPLTATGGTGPYTWTASGLPDGLTLTPDGVISGSVTGTGTSTVTTTVTDTETTTRTAELTLSVPGTVPADCIGQACAVLTPNGQTVQVPADHIISVTRDPTTAKLTHLLLTTGTAHPGDALVLAPTPDIPSGAIVVVTTVTTNPDDTQTVAVQAAGPADAYADGTVQALDTPAPAAAQPNLTGPTPAAPGAAPDANQPAPLAATAPAAAATLSCNGGVTSELHGLSVVPSLTTAVAALWEHPFFGGGGIYVGAGGLDLFQFDLDGSITLNVGVTVSGAASCTLNGPELVKAIPAGNFGAVILKLQPSLTLKVTGKVDLRASATLRCGAEYRWSQGHESRISYCNSSTQPLQLSSDTGVDATLTAAIDASVTLNDIIGITGTLSATLHAGYHPTQHPVAVLDATAGYELGACLACFWKDSPTRVTLVTGTFFKKTLGTWDNPPPKPGDPTGPPVIATTTLKTGTVGTAYTTRLTTTDHRPGTWSITGGAAPPGLTLTGDLLAGTPTTAATAHFTLTFIDTAQRTATAAATITINPTPTGGPVWAWGSGGYGQLGNGGTADSLVPVQVSGLTDVTAIAGNSSTGYAVRRDGTVWAWGQGWLGTLGNGGTADSLVPVQVSGLTGVTAIAAGGSTGYAVRGDGTVWAWGYGWNGQLGNGGTETSSLVPVQVSGLTDVTAIAANGSTGYAVRGDGTVWAWGYGTYGALGNGGTAGSLVPVQVSGLTGVAAIAAGYYTGYAVRGDGTVWAWGYGTSGELGNGGTADSAVPVQVSGLTDVAAIAGGAFTGYAVRGDGTVWAWGSGRYGALGNGGTAGSLVPVQVPGLTNVTAIAGGNYTGYAVRGDGTAWAWGYGTSGELGNGGTADSAVPMQVSG